MMGKFLTFSKDFKHSKSFFIHLMQDWDVKEGVIGLSK